MNCLKTRHMIKHLSSQQHCRCQKQHHTLQHVEVKAREPQVPPQTLQSPPSHYSTPQSHLPPSTVTPNHCGRSVLSHVAQLATRCTHSLLMTACVLISSPRSASIQARALLDSASSSSFISEHLTQYLRLPRSKHFPQITGIGGIVKP